MKAVMINGGVGIHTVMNKYTTTADNSTENIKNSSTCQNNNADCGMTHDNGDDVFIYPKGIKIHKKYWIKEASTDTSNQIFMINEMSDFDGSKSLYLFEGEKDAIASKLQGVSFSSLFSIYFFSFMRYL